MISGKAVDGYLQNSTVCLDLDSNGICGGLEPIAVSNDNGGYTLEISTDVQENKNYKDAPLIVYGGMDKDSGEAFTGLLQSPRVGTSVNITPISTLITQAIKDGMSLDEAKSKIAVVTSLDQEQLLKDPVDELNRGDSKLIKKAIQIHKAVEAIAIKRSSNDSELRSNVNDVYALLVDGLKNDANDIDDMLDKALESSESELAKQVTSQIEKAFTEIPDTEDKLSKIAISTEMMLKDVKNDEDIQEIDFGTMDWNAEYIKRDLQKIGIEVT
ncbi:MAG: hypothetical protein GXO30_03580, partial [Epsilonproteobacteria bacterium]|nr:hypothetical protein [Campylobacterota bacterium]